MVRKSIQVLLKALRFWTQWLLMLALIVSVLLACNADSPLSIQPPTTSDPSSVAATDADPLQALLPDGFELGAPEAVLSSTSLIQPQVRVLRSGSDVERPFGLVFDGSNLLVAQMARSLPNTGFRMLSTRWH